MYWHAYLTTVTCGLVWWSGSGSGGSFTAQAFVTTRQDLNLISRKTSTTSIPKVMVWSRTSDSTDCGGSHDTNIISQESRRAVLRCMGGILPSFLGLGSAMSTPLSAQAIGPVKIFLEPDSYVAKPCPPSKPIPGQMAMKGMRGLCVTVQATLQEPSPKDLDKVGVYGFITDGETGDSVLANNPDLSTDAGQFAMIDVIKSTDKKVTFEFVAAVPMDKNLSQYENGIGPLNFEGIRIISYPGGQQFGAISPCEMNEFSEECEAWEKENGPYQKAEFMMKSNPRTKGR